MQYSLDEYPVYENERERHDEENVGEVEDELGDVLLGAVALHVPVGHADLKGKGLDESIGRIVYLFFRGDVFFHVKKRWTFNAFRLYLWLLSVGTTRNVKNMVQLQHQL